MGNELNNFKKSFMPKEEKIEDEVKELRVKIDGLSQLVKELKPDVITGTSNGKDFYYNPPEVRNCYDSLIFAKAWLGKILAELGTINPYKSGYKTKEDIEPTADVSNIDLNETVTMGLIEKIDWLRTEIEKLVILIKDLNGTTESKPSREFAIARTNSYNYLCEAKFWLGFELQRIKEEK